MFNYELTVSELPEHMKAVVEAHASVMGIVLDVEENEDEVWSYSLYFSCIKSVGQLYRSVEMMESLFGDLGILHQAHINVAN